MWSKFSDRYPTGRRIRFLPDATFRLHVVSIIWCCGEETDGWIADDELEAVLDAARVKQAHVEKLVEAGLWERRPGGWQVSDQTTGEPGWDQRPAAKVREDRAKTAERVKRHRNGGSNAVTDPDTNGVGNGSPVLSSPDLSRSTATSQTRASTAAVEDPSDPIAQLARIDREAV